MKVREFIDLLKIGGVSVHADFELEDHDIGEENWFSPMGYPVASVVIHKGEEVLSFSDVNDNEDILNAEVKKWNISAEVDADEVTNFIEIGI